MDLIGPWFKEAKKKKLQVENRTRDDITEIH